MSSHTLIASLSLSELFSISISLIQSLSSVSWTRGARPRGNLLYGQTWLETPDPVRSPKLSNHGRVQYSGGGPPGKRTYCTVSHHISVLPTSEVRTSESPGGAEDFAKFRPVLPSYARGVLWSWSSALGTWRGLGQIPEYCGVGLLPWGLGGSKAKLEIPTLGPCGGQHSGLAVVLP